MLTTKRLALSLATAALLGACDASDAGLVGPEGEAAVRGRIERETEVYTAQQPAPAGASGAGGDSGSASTVEVARVNANGSLTAVAHGTVSGNGDYRVEGVATGRSDLVVVARSASGAELGRVLLAGAASGGGDKVAAPMNAETTLQGLVYTEVRVMGKSASEVSSAELELLLVAEQNVAAQAARSRAEVRALATAYVEAAETMTRSYARLGHNLSAGARQRLLLSAQAEHHALLHAGAEAEASYDSYAQTAVEALVRGGAKAEAVVLASAAARAALSEALEAEGGSAASSTVTARAAARLNLAARLQLLPELPDSARRERERTAEALLRARLRVRLAWSAAEVEDAMEDAEAEARQGLVVELGALLGGATLETRSRVEAALVSALEAADLSAELSAQTSPSARAEAVLRYRQRVDAAAQTYVSTAPSGMSLQASVAADLFIAARAG